MLPVPTAMPNQAQFALFSDWGTGLYGAQPIAETIAQRSDLDYVVHLGDVYYAGTPKEVANRFLALWPQVEGATKLALNSNHEMYSGGHAYFEQTLPAFGQKSSYFALQNDHWLVVGLDTVLDHRAVRSCSPVTKLWHEVLGR